MATWPWNDVGRGHRVPISDGEGKKMSPVHTHRLIDLVSSLLQVLQGFGFTIHGVFTTSGRNSLCWEVLRVLPVCVVVDPAAVELNRTKERREREASYSIIVTTLVSLRSRNISVCACESDPHPSLDVVHVDAAAAAIVVCHSAVIGFAERRFNLWD